MFVFDVYVCAAHTRHQSYRKQFAGNVEHVHYFEHFDDMFPLVITKQHVVLFIDADDYAGDIAKLCRHIKKLSFKNPSAVVAVIASFSDKRLSALASVGAHYVLKRPFTKHEFLFLLYSIRRFKKIFLKEEHILRDMQELTHKLDSWGYMDVLTQCYNYRYFSRRLTEASNRSARTGNALSCAVFDIKSFASVNDVYGLEIGDVVIAQFSRVLKESARAHDVVCRTGGHEFSVLLEDTAIESAKQFAERIIERVESTHFGTDKEYLKITVGVGVSAMPGKSVVTSAELIKAAKHALKVAQDREGSCVATFDDAPREVDRMGPAQLKNKIADLNQLLNQGMLDMVYGFARLIEAKDQYTGQHVECTRSLAERIAKELQLSDDQIVNIKHAAILHDLGKIGIDDQILRKPGRLTLEEFDEIKKHPVIAAEVLKSVHALKEALPAIHYHHERYDGKGYPDGLKGEEIPLLARIVAVADVYQALTSDRPYRKGFDKAAALKIINDERGKQFDPAVVDVFVKVMEEEDVGEA
jgi:diguanylate cyclase (GGDEF)-like protein